MVRAHEPPRDLAAILSSFHERGFAPLGQVLDEVELGLLRERADQLMQGEVTYPGLFFQLDTESGRYQDLEYGKGWQGPSLNYRKIEKLELDARFRSYLESPLFEGIAKALIGESITLYRALLMNKPEGGGTVLPFHQDGGRLWGLDRDPLLQIWTALDDAGLDGGCLEVVPGSHRGGLATPLGGLIPEEIVRASGNESRALPLPAKAGEAFILHCQLWHRSGISNSGHPRRAFTTCYLDARTRCLRTRRAPRQFVPLFSAARRSE